MKLGGYTFGVYVYIIIYIYDTVCDIFFRSPSYLIFQTNPNVWFSRGIFIDTIQSLEGMGLNDTAIYNGIITTRILI
jgi:hypothetical protein